MKRSLKPSVSITLFHLLLLASLNGCYDDVEMTDHVFQKEKEEETLVLNAKKYFEEEILPIRNDQDEARRKHNYRAGLAKSAQWQNAYIREMSVGRGIVIPLLFSESLYAKIGKFDAALPINDASYLLMYKDKDKKMHTEVVTSLPDEDYFTNTDNEKPFSGIVIVEDWFGNFIKGYRYSNGMIKNLTQPGSVNSGKMAIVCTTTDWYTCTSVDGSSYSCRYDYSETVCDSGGGGGSLGGGTGGGDYGGGYHGSGGGGGSGRSETVVVTSPKNPIVNIIEYLKCIEKNQVPH